MAWLFSIFFPPSFYFENPFTIIVGQDTRMWIIDRSTAGKAKAKDFTK